MKKDTFYILKRDGAKFEQVTGYAVPNEFGIDLSVYKYVSDMDVTKWNVTDRKSGSCVGVGFSRSAAIKNALGIIRKLGVEEYEKVIEIGIGRYGLSPLYKQENEEKEGGNGNEGSHDEPACDEVSELF